MSECIYPQNNEITIKARNGYTIENPSFEGNTLYVDCVPKPPKKKHYCEYKDGQVVCETFEDRLMITERILESVHNQYKAICFATYCPFCGEKE